MKKTITILMAIIISISIFSGTANAAEEYSFELEYTGEIIANEEKDAAVSLIGVNGTQYTNVRIKVEVTGPATPKLIATDSLSNQIDIAETGYWGPDGGFPIQGSFTNRTPIKATFPMAGDYSIKLSLINLNNSNNAIITRDFQIHVSEPETNTPTENTIIGNTTENIITEIPKTGLSFGEMGIYAIFAVLIIVIAYMLYMKKIKN